MMSWKNEHITLRGWVIFIFVLFPLLCQDLSAQTLLNRPNTPRSQQPSQQEIEMLQLQRKIQRARLMENQGRLETAAALYRTLFQENPDHRRVYELYRDVLIRMGEYERAQKLIQEYLQKNPDDIGSMVSLGTIYFSQENKEKALFHWQNVIDRMNHRLQAYQLVLNTMIQHGLHSEASSLVRTAREELNQPAFFALQFGSYYSSRMNYGKATREYLLYYLHRGQNEEFLVSQLSRFPDETDVHQQVIPVISTALEDNKKNPGLLKVMADYQYRIQEYDAALDFYQRLENQENLPGKYRLQVASDLLNDHEYGTAIQVYTDLLDDSKTDIPRSELLLGASEAKYQQLLQQYEDRTETGLFRQNEFWDTDFVIIPEHAGRTLSEIVNDFQAVIEDFPETPHSFFAEFRLGEIFFTLGNDFDQAINYFSIVANNPQHPMQQESLLNIGLCHLAKGDIATARSHWEEMLNSGPESITVRHKAELYTAATYLYSGDLSTGIAEMDSMITNLTLSSQEYNDLLEVQTFVRNRLKKNIAADSSAMREFFRGEFYLKQHKISEAQRTFLHSIELEESEILAPYALIRTSQFSRMLNEREEVENLLLRVINTYPDSEIIDHALFKLGRLYQENNQPDEAIQWYEKILTDYPGSMLEQKSRTLIRQLQQQTS